jgi:hypothetical protein
VDRDGTWQLQHLLDALEAPRELSG